MSADQDFPFSGDPTRYRKLAEEVRALIDSGTLHAHETLEDLLQLAAWYEAVAKLAAPLRQADVSADEAPIKP